MGLDDVCRVHTTRVRRTRGVHRDVGRGGRGGVIVVLLGTQEIVENRTKQKRPSKS
jgi:hypothetical protein